MTLDRRRFLTACSAAGISSTLLPGALFTLATQAAAQEKDVKSALPKITAEMVNGAAAIAGITIAADQMQMLLGGLNDQRDTLTQIRAMHIPYDVAPAFIFDPVPGGMKLDTTKHPMRMSAAPMPSTPPDIESLAFCTVRELAELVRTRKVSSLELTKMYIARLKRYDAKLHFVITLTEERALAQARAADKEIAAGKYRGPLHGLPWGAKDLLAVKGYRTTWGAGGFEQQQINEDATVVQRLDAAGAVLVAKLSLGALAMGDKWFGGRTRNPWNPAQGSSGSSAGSASSVAAGCVAFAIGSETLGSISSPSTRCGCSGLRPTFGFVPRTGAMALSWSMDKLGPICRAVEDCAIVLDAIYGPDGHDRAVQKAAFNWDAEFDWRKLRIGYLAKEFAAPVPPKPTADAGTFRPNDSKPAEIYARRVYDHQFDVAALAAMKKLGVELVPVTLPDLPADAMVPLLTAEGAAAFDEMTRSGRDRLLTEQTSDDWPNLFRTSRFYSAVDYVQAMRARTMLMHEMAKVFEQVDVIVTPSTGNQLTITNLTGHPAVIVPNGLRGKDSPPPASHDNDTADDIGGPGTPVSLTFLGALYSDARLAAVARAYQEMTGFHKLHPKLD